MKLNKLLLTAEVLALCAAPAMAQDFGDFGAFDDDSSAGASSKIEVSGNVSMEARAYVDAEDGDKVADEKIEVTGKPSGKLELSYSGNNSDMTLSLNMDADMIKNNPEDIIDELVLRERLGDYVTVEAGKMKIVWGKGDKLHVLDNFNADNYSDFIIPDYLDRRVSTPMIRGIISLPVANLNLEGVYTPLLPVDRFAVEGRWTPAQVSALTASVTENAKNQLAVTITQLENARMQAETAASLKALGTTDAQNKLKAMVTTAYTEGKISYTSAEVVAYCTENGLDPTVPAYQQAAAGAILAQKYEAYLTQNLTDANSAYNLALANVNSLSSNPGVIYPNMNTLKYGQFGGRATWTLGQLDMGISYYNGWYKQPSVNASKIDSFITGYLANGKVSEDQKFLAYDKKQTFGVEASSIIWHFNVRGEFAYNLTDDTKGTDPWVHNNSMAWLAGFDIDLPFWNANLNVQEIGTYVMKGDECDKNKANVNYGTDVDYCANGYTNNKIAANFTASFMNDKIASEVTVMYGVENKDLVVLPKLSYKPDQNLTLTVSGLFINCGDTNSEFKAWENNSFVSLGASYKF